MKTPLVLCLTAAALAGCLRRGDYVPAPPAPPAPPPAVAAGPLDATSAVRLALVRNPNVRLAAARVAGARARLGEAHAALWPRLAADVTYLVADAPSAYLFKRIDARALPPDVDFNEPGGFENVESGVTLRWNLWNGGRDVLGVWSAESEIAAAAAAADAVRNDLVATVLASYLAARAAAALQQADETSLGSVGAQVRETQVRVEGGAALRSDLLSLEVRLAEARQQLLRSEIAERTALASLRELLALPPDAPLTLAGDAVEHTELPEDEAAALALAYRHRADVQAARHRVEQAAIAVARAKRAYLPRLDVDARLYADDAGARLDPGDPNWLVAVALSVDLFDGLAREARIRGARAALDAVEWEDRSLLLQVGREVDVAYLRLREARERREVARAAVDAAEETMDIVSTRYGGGAETVTRYLEAEAAAARARSNAIGARLDAERAAVELARVLGLFADRPVEGES